MTVSLTLDEQAGYRVAITGTGLDVEPDVSQWTLYRETVTETRVPVRGFRDRIDLPAAFVAFDVEAPLGRPVFYTLAALLDDGTTTEWQAGPVDIETAYPVISNPVTGAYVDLDAVEEWPELNYSGRTAVIPVFGRPDPVVVSDAGTYPTSSPVLRTDSTTKRLALRAMLLAGQVVLLRAPEPDVEDTYLAPTDWAEVRVTRSSADVRRFHNLAAAHVAPPSYDLPATGSTLEDLADAVPGTLLDLSNTFTTLLDLAAADLSEI